MATNSINNNGCSICAKGSEKYVRYTACNRKKYYQYDYRTDAGELFSCVAPTLEQCRQRRDMWLNKLNGYN